MKDQILRYIGRPTLIFLNAILFFRNASTKPGPNRIPSSELRRLLAIQIGQLRTLFGLPAAPKRSAEVQTLSPGPKGFGGW